MRITYKNYLYESIVSSDKIIGTDIELYHGTGEEISGELRPGGYDNVLWFSRNSKISQSYIPKCGLYMNVSTRSAIKPSKRLENIQKQLGIVFDVEYNSRGEATSWSIISPEIFNTADTIHRKKFEEIYPLNKRAEELTKIINNNVLLVGDLSNISDEEYSTLEKKFEKLTNELSDIEDKLKILNKQYKETEPDVIKMEYVDEQLSKLGYEPDEYSSGFHGNNYKVMIGHDDKILNANYVNMGKLYIAKPKRDLKFLDISTGESDLTELQYHYVKIFRQAEKDGYDGIIIDDFAQHDTMGNVGHTSYGIFKKSIKDLEFEVIDACHPEDISREHSNEYKKHRGIK